MTYDEFGDGTAGSTYAEGTGGNSATTEETQAAISSGSKNEVDYASIAANLLGSSAALANNRRGRSQVASPQLNAALAMLLSDTQQGRKDFSKEAAAKDSEAAVAAIFRDYKNIALPKVYGAQTGSGGYNSTGVQLLANDAYGSAVAKAAELKLKTQSEYEKNKAMQLEQLTKLLGTQAVATKPAAEKAQTSKTQDASNMANIAMALSTLYGG